MTVSGTSKPNNTMDEWIEGLVAMGFCTGGVYVGTSISNWPIFTVPILLAYIAVYVPLAIWITKRRWARGQRSIF